MTMSLKSSLSWDNLSQAPCSLSFSHLPLFVNSLFVNAYLSFHNKGHKKPLQRFLTDFIFHFNDILIVYINVQQPVSGLYLTQNSKYFINRIQPPLFHTLLITEKESRNGYCSKHPVSTNTIPINKGKKTAHC